MRASICIFFLLAQVLFFGCNPKYGTHEIVYFNEDKKASDDVYISFLTNQIEQYPEEEDNYLKLANIYKGQNNPLKAIELLQKAEKENPESIDVLIDLSSFYLQDKNIEKLSNTLKSIMNIDMDNMNFLKLSAGYSLLLNDYTNAMFFANRAILANPYDDENLFLRGSAQLINRDSLSALISFEDAYKLKNSDKSSLKIFDLALALGNHNKARKFLDEITLNNTTRQLCYEWGAYFNEIGKRDTSKIILLKCLRERPDEPRINFELAKIYFNVNNIDSTLYYVNQYLDSKPIGTDGYVLKARTLEKINYYTDAKELYKIALDMDSTSILASKGLDNLERKVAYLRLKKRKEEVQRQVEILKPLNSKEIN
ncbi:MAG: hypothetical protein KAQ62_07870 [Cyclobacteriaceae bacterium]|nr:hypothetical protein [Cyclobacteriaceae bacterium]